MLVTSTHLIGTPILSMQAGGAIGQVSDIIVDPNTLHIIAFHISGRGVSRDTNILATSSVREYFHLGMVIDSAEELVAADDIVKISKILALHFNLIGLKVESKKHSKIGRVTDYTFTPDDFSIQQLIVRRPIMKSFSDPSLTIHRREIIEITDYKVIVKDDAKTIKARSESEDFIPNFVNPFRKTEQDFAPSDSQTLADKDRQ